MKKILSSFLIGIQAAVAKRIKKEAIVFILENDRDKRYLKRLEETTDAWFNQNLKTTFEQREKMK